MKALPIFVGALLSACLTLASVIKPPEGFPLPVLSAPTNNTCQEPPAFDVGYQSDGASLLKQGAAFRFQGISWLEARVCEPGKLVLQGNGEQAANQDPQLSISLDTRSLGEVKFLPTGTTASVEVPAAGLLRLAYLNDYYAADVRVASFSKFKFQAATCKDFGVDVPKETGGEWQPALNVATLVSNVPMTLTPCDSGSLTLQVLGRAGQSVFPSVKFEQGGKTVLLVQTTDKPQAVQLNLESAPLKITLVNPYGRTLEDRNLNLTSLQFIPARKP